MALSLGCTTRIEIVGDLVLIEVRRREAEINRRELMVRGFELDDSALRLQAEDRCEPAPPSTESA